MEDRCVMSVTRHLEPDTWNPTPDFMNTPIKILIVCALAVAVIAAVALKNGKVPSEPKSGVSSGASIVAPVETTNTLAASPAVAAKLPKLIDLGADKCIPCKMMAPILEELKKDYAGRLSVVFIDVWKDSGAGEAYGVEVIPTQIFFDADGKEVFRHVGFFSKEDILGKWKELGVDLSGKVKPVTRPVETSGAASDPSTNKPATP
jgi:thioredoxin 1